MEESSFDKLRALLRKEPVVKEVAKKVTVQEDKFSEIESLLSKESRVLSEINKQIMSFGFLQILFSNDSSDTKEVLIALVKKCFVEKKTPVLVLFSTNYKSMLDLLNESKINSEQIIIIDTVSKNISRVKESRNLLFVDSLRNLTQLEIKSVNIIGAVKDPCFIFDSMSVLDLFHKEDVILKFFYSFTKLLHRKSVPGVYLISKKKALPKVMQFFDDFVEMEKI